MAGALEFGDSLQANTLRRRDTIHKQAKESQAASLFRHMAEAHRSLRMFNISKRKRTTYSQFGHGRERKPHSIRSMTASGSGGEFT